MLRAFIIFILIFIPTLTFSQSFYVTIPVDGINLGNKLFQLNTECDSLEIFSCPPTEDTLQYPANQYLDIAMDKEQNLYFVTGWLGHLYKRSLNDSTSCEYLGPFVDPPNALVSDSADILYAVTNVGACKLMRYNITTGVFDLLGSLPSGYYSAGDLFFYEHRLFLTATNSNSASFLVEIDVDNPSQSCYYMDLQNLNPHGAFSINYGTYSKAYILSTDQQPGLPTGSSLIELDIVNKTIGNPICSYPFYVAGAATFYSKTASNTNCTTTTFVDENLFQENYPEIFPNPFSSHLTLSSSDNVNWTNIILYNHLGQRILHKTLINSKTINTKELAKGIYYYELKDSKGKLKTGKIVKL